MKKIGLFDSGIGGFSLLIPLFDKLPHAEYFYYSDDLNAPYGPKSDEFIIERSILITEELLNKGVDLIVVACNTATAASISKLREKFVNVPFVGVEPYLNAYYKMSEDSKLAVLTTESTGKSERFKNLKERLDPTSKIEAYSLKNLAKLIENFYYENNNHDEFNLEIEKELSPLLHKKYTGVILGCTHYPLIKTKIENFLSTKAISPCEHIAMRVKSLIEQNFESEINQTELEYFNFYSSKNKTWELKKRMAIFGPYKGTYYV